MNLVLDRRDLFVGVLRRLDLAGADAARDRLECADIRGDIAARGADHVELLVVLDEVLERGEVVLDVPMRLLPLGEVVGFLVGRADVEEVVLLEAAHVQRGDVGVVRARGDGDVDVHDVRCGVDGRCESPLPGRGDDDAESEAHAESREAAATVSVASIVSISSTGESTRSMSRMSTRRPSSFPMPVRKSTRTPVPNDGGGSI